MKRSTSARLTFCTFTLSLMVACGPIDEAPVGDTDTPVAGYDDLFAGAPSNSSLPSGMKADTVYPKLHTGLLAIQSPVKSQGRRGVCSIFATVAQMEHLYLKAGELSPDFSEQYLQWSVKRQLGAYTSSSGSNGQTNLRAISKFGIPDEAAWPYEADQWGPSDDPACTGKDPMPTKCYTNGEPPQQAVSAEKHKLPAPRWINTDGIKDEIQSKGIGVVVGLDFFYQAWNHRKSTLPTSGTNWNQGIVLFPNDEDIEESHKQRAGHAVLIVGWDDELEVERRDKDGNTMRDTEGKPITEKGFYIFKNSWGAAGFGIDNPHGAGYGFLSIKYVEDYGSAVASDPPKGGSNPVGEAKEQTFTGSVKKGASAYHTLQLAKGAREIKIAMSGDNDADLYTRFGATPTSKSYDCRPYKSGSDETCEHASATATTLKIKVVGWASNTSSYTIKATWIE